MDMIPFEEWIGLEYLMPSISFGLYSNFHDVSDKLSSIVIPYFFHTSTFERILINILFNSLVRPESYAMS